MHLFWASHFILPKKVAKDIEQSLRKYLWSGPELKTSGAKVTWDDVVLPKEEGGLGIKRVTDWNRALISKHLWKIISGSTISSWAMWVRRELIGNRNFWRIPIPANASWSWRKILGLRASFCPLVRYHIGDGRATWLWYDPWLPIGPIVEKWGDRIIYDSGLSRDARVEVIIHRGAWRWPVANSPALLELKREPLPTVCSNGGMDIISWLPSSSGQFSTHSAWDAFRLHKATVSWYELVWATPSIPRASFMTWLALKRRLSTQDRLLRWGLISDIQCHLCGSLVEDHDHLFRTCLFTERVWTMGLIRLDMQCPLGDFDNLINFFVSSFSGNHIRTWIARLFFTTTVYWIWRERNARFHRQETRNETQLFTLIMRWVGEALQRHHLQTEDVIGMSFARRWGL